LLLAPTLLLLLLLLLLLRLLRLLTLLRLLLLMLWLSLPLPLLLLLEALPLLLPLLLPLRIRRLYLLSCTASSPSIKEVEDGGVLAGSTRVSVVSLWGSTRSLSVVTNHLTSNGATVSSKHEVHESNRRWGAWQ
jgi:hypothetical protein